MLETLLLILPWSLVAVVALIALFNLYMLVLPSIRKASAAEQGRVSPVPLVGTLLLYVASLIAPEGALPFAVVLSLLVADTAGLPWLILWAPVIVYLQTRSD